MPDACVIGYINSFSFLSSLRVSLRPRVFLAGMVWRFEVAYGEISLAVSGIFST